MKISVIIPSRDREEALRKCLLMLGRQTIKPYEVLIIENDNKGHYGHLAREFSSLPVKVFLEKKIGKSHPRNRGIEIARGEVFAFLDDDCLSAKDWLAQIKKSFEDAKIDVVLGDSQEKANSLLMKAYEFQYKKFFLAARIDFSTGRVLCGAALNTRNFAIKKKFILKHDLSFDSRYDRFGFAEDTDFGEQIEQCGGKMFFNKKMKVTHHEKEGFLPLLVKKFQNGRAMVVLQKKGIFHDFKIAKRERYFTFERSKELIRGESLIKIVLLLFYLNLIIISYRLGRYFQLLKNAIFKR